MKVIYDIKVLKSCFTYTDYNIDNKTVTKFVIHKNIDDRYLFYEYLKQCKLQIGFNNLSFDYPILHLFLTKKHIWSKFSTEKLILWLYNKGQELINSEESHRNIIPQNEILISQLDLFRIWHYNNKARNTSLKALQISMNYHNVLETPIDHSRNDISLDEIPAILEYNLNNVLATHKFWQKSQTKIELRENLKENFKINCLNWSDSKIGERLILSLYLKKTGLPYNSVIDMRSKRLKIALNEIILPYIKFESEKFQILLEKFKKLEVSELKNAFDYEITYNGLKYIYGLGGIHGSQEGKIFESDDDYIIIDADVAQLYPRLAITNRFYPEHLGKEFVDVYEQLTVMRAEAKKQGNDSIADAMKLASNSCYGKSNDINSFLYDPKFTVSITVNGQLLLTMLIEQLSKKVPGLEIIQVNTDGITVKIPNNQHIINTYYNVCNDWQQLTSLTLEYKKYHKMWIADVNNYGALDTEGKVKNKGRFEVDKVVGSEPAYHKDNSFRIVSIALQEYFVNNTPVEQTIKNHTNIYDFCGRQKFKKDSDGYIYRINGQNIDKIKQQKNTRYYISNKGNPFIKHYSTNEIEAINKGYLVTIFDKFENKSNYDITYSFYIKECYKEIDIIENKQLILFE